MVYLVLVGSWVRSWCGYGEYGGHVSCLLIKTAYDLIFFAATKKDLWIVEGHQRLPMYRREAIHGHVLRIEIDPICFHWDTMDCPIEVVSLTD